MIDADLQQVESDAQTRAAHYRETNPHFARWASGYGVINHTDVTQVRIHALVEQWRRDGVILDEATFFNVLCAADRLANSAMWLVVHMTYAKRVYRDGRVLGAEDFKPDPEGHTGGSLNMVPAYVGYLAANSLSGLTRAWLMGQGHCVAAIDATNLLVGNLTPVHAQRYRVTDEGLTRFVRDFYSYAVRPDGTPDSPLGSHVNAHTAGGLMEGGYLGFAELQYPHMPLPGEHLVVFLSDGAFEGQRGADWVPRWWRPEDCGVITPFMIMNGRRIDERSSVEMKGGVSWFDQHLRLNGFVPINVDGRDPAAMAWGILEMEARQARDRGAMRGGRVETSFPVYYGVASTIKGFGFPGAGTNSAHNLPLQGNPVHDPAARGQFNEGARRLWVSPDELSAAVHILNQHAFQRRPRERDHPLARRAVPIPVLPAPPWKRCEGESALSPMQAIDDYFCAIVKDNPGLRPRVGNPDEMRSNGLGGTLDLLKHRVTRPEPGVAEATQGAVITALNEEAVVCAALANKGGINLVASYEAFAVKMLGAIRQELIFARHLVDAGEEPGWLAVPVIATSHTWENGKNEQSHQDPTFCEALLGEMTDVSRVLFPADWNCALAALQAVYSVHGQIWTLVVPKRPVPVRFSPEQARQLMERGAVRVRVVGYEDERLQLIATGAYQLTEILKASERLEYAGVDHTVIYLQEPGRFRIPRDERESAEMIAGETIDSLFPDSAAVRVFLTHTRPEPFIGTLWPLLRNPVQTPVLGYVNRGGTLNEQGMLFANRCTWVHVLAAAAVGLGDQPEVWLNESELGALMGQCDPRSIFEPDLRHLE